MTLRFNDPNGLPFDPVVVRERLAALRKQAAGLEALLESYGLPIQPPDTSPTRPIAKVRHGAARSRGGTVKATANKGKKPTLADAAFEVLQELPGHRAHGRQIEEGVIKRGMLKDVQHPQSSISTALTRDPRFAKDQTAPNTWMLREAQGR